MQDYKEEVVRRRPHCPLVDREVTVFLTYRHYKFKTEKSQFDCEEERVCVAARGNSRCPLYEDFDRCRLT